MKIGTAKLESNKTIFKLEDGDNPFRILPPLGNLADKGKFFQFYAIEWGYKNSDGKMVPFQDCSVKNYQTGMIEVESAARLKRVKLEEELEQAVKDFKAKKITKDQLTEISKKKMQFNLDKKYYFNAVDINGEIGLLKLGYKTQKQVMSLVKKYRDENGQDIVGMKGLYFNINKSGKGRDTQYVVTPYQENVEAEINGQKTMVKQDKYHTIDDTFVARLSGSAWELDGLYPAPTPEEVERMVNGGPLDVDAILGKKEPTKPAAGEAVIPEEVKELVKESTPEVTEAVDTSTGEITETPAEDSVEAPVVDDSQADDEFLKEMGF